MYWLALVLVASAVACSKTNGVESTHTESCNFAVEKGASFCPANTHPTGFIAKCDEMDEEEGSKCLATTLNDCFVNCTPAKCGDGYLDTGEECDSGEDNGSGEGCDATCHLSKGAACGSNGDLRCAPDNAEVQLCVDNLWQSKTVCSDDQTCDSESKQCEFVAGYCETVGERECVGDFGRRECGGDNRWEDDPCPKSAPKCVATSSGTTCAADEDAAVSANYRINLAEFAIGGIYGFAESGKYRAQLGTAKR